jgi:acyl CoA:acetate/3-ketoacid CoA transferase beta subunit
VVHVIVTEYATFDVTPKGLLLRDKAPDISLDELKRLTEPSFAVS